VVTTKRHWIKQPILWIILLGFALRIGGIGYGLPYLFHPDEKRQILEAFAMAGAGSPLSVTYVYPVFHSYVLLVLYGLIYGVGKLIGVYQVPNDLAFHFLVDPTLFIILSRLLSVASGLATVYVIYRIGCLLFSSRAGWIAATIALANFLLVQISQWALVESLICFLGIMAFFFMLKGIREQNMSLFLWASIFSGLAISSKYQGIFLVPPLLSAIWFSGHQDRIKKLLYSGILLFLFGTIGNLTWFFQTGAMWDRFLVLGGEAQFGISSAPIFSNNVFDYTLWFISQLVIQQGLVGLALVAGLFYAIWRRSSVDLVLLVFVFLMLYGLSQSSLRQLYFGSMMLPILCVFSGRLIADLFKITLFRTRGGLRAALVTAVILPSVIGLIRTNLLKSHPDTRVLAKQWVEKNVPSDSKIAIDWYAFGPPLTNLTPPVLKGPRNLESSGGLLPETLADRYQTYVSEQGTYYEVESVIHPKTNPTWPQSMPVEARQRSEESPFLKRAYSWFQFEDLELLRNRGVELIIISSYSYSYFLIDQDPNKKPTFNPFFREDTLTRNRQASEYNPAHTFGLSFFLAERARSWYEQFLVNPEQNGVSLVKEFYPSQKNWGPVIKVYQVQEKQTGGSIG
jgi:4-amino-4-deoxy-L-arabinose transferase-like glycosyltransferase